MLCEGNIVMPNERKSTSDALMRRRVNEIMSKGNEAFARKMVGHIRVNLADSPVVKVMNEVSRKAALRQVN